MMKKKLVFLALNKRHLIVTTYLPKVWFHVFVFSFCQNKIPDPKLLPKKTDQECLKSLTQGTYLTNFFTLLSSLPPTHPRAGHDLASTLLHIKLFLGYIE